MIAHLNRRRSYCRIYIPVAITGTVAVLDDKGRAQAFTDWDDARRLAAPLGYIVVGWHWFRERTMTTLREKPTAFRIQGMWMGRLRVHHAELDASDEELQALIQTVPSDAARHPKEVAAMLANTKVWEIEIEKLTASAT